MDRKGEGLSGFYELSDDDAELLGPDIRRAWPAKDVVELFNLVGKAWLDYIIAHNVPHELIGADPTVLAAKGLGPLATLNAALDTVEPFAARLILDQVRLTHQIDYYFSEIGF